MTVLGYLIVFSQEKDLTLLHASIQVLKTYFAPTELSSFENETHRIKIFHQIPKEFVIFRYWEQNSVYRLILRNQKMESTTKPTSLAIFGKIFTANRKNLWAEAILIENDRIAFVGTQAECKQIMKSGSSIKVLESDELVIPGFIDSHIHPIAGGLMEMDCKITGIPSLELASPVIKDYIIQNPDFAWIRASTYEIGWFVGSNPPTYRDLDLICPDKPLVLMRSDCHSYFVNSKALQAAGIDESTPNPPKGVIEKDAEGKLTGVLHEDAMNLIRAASPRLNDEAREKALFIALDLMMKEGITAFNDACVKPHSYKAYKKYAEQIKLGNPRAALSIGWDQLSPEEKSGFTSSILAEKLKIAPSEKIKISTIKIFVDGVLESKTALFEEPYLSDKGEPTDVPQYGQQNMTEVELDKICESLHANNCQIHSHCIGDKASRMVLDSIEKAKKTLGEKDLRHYVAHAQFINKKDIARFKDLDVGCCFSTVWCQVDEFTATAEKCLGVERVNSQYPIKSLLKIGAKVSFGSDWPVSTFRPLDAIEVAVTRRALGGKGDKEPLVIDEAIEVQDAILAYTIDSAWQQNWDNDIGSLEVGKKADLVILDRNIFNIIEKSSIHKAQVVATMIDGMFVFQKLSKI